MVFLNKVFQILGLFLLAACSSSSLGYGVILWTEPEKIAELTNAQVISITGESKVKQSYQFGYQGQTHNLPISRVAFFRHRSHAEEYREKFLEYRNWYAINQNPSGLVMRALPSIRAEQVYRLRPNQAIKILEQASEKETLGDIEGKWYEVLTDDGVRGYVFDYYLRIEDRDQQTKIIKQRTDKQESAELKISLASLEGYWYLKDYVQQMREGEKLDIRLLELPHGQFKRESDRLKLYFQKPYSKAFTIAYTEGAVDMSTPSELKFLDSGTRITFETVDTISIYYRDAEDQEIISELQRITEKELDLYRQEALAKRNEDLAYILERGSQFSAPELYGTIRFRTGGYFDWSNTQALVDQKMLLEPQKEGNIYFLYSLDTSLKNRYDKVITFAFANGEEISFFLKIDDDQVYMRYLPAYISKKSNLISSDAITEKIDLQMVLAGRPLISSF